MPLILAPYQIWTGRHIKMLASKPKSWMRHCPQPLCTETLRHR